MLTTLLQLLGRRKFQRAREKNKGIEEVKSRGVNTEKETEIVGTREKKRGFIEGKRKFCKEGSAYLNIQIMLFYLHDLSCFLEL